MSNWISVDDRLPARAEDLDVKYHTEDIIAYDGEDVFVDKWESVAGGDWCHFNEFGITHWMPLPEPPEEE